MLTSIGRRINQCALARGIGIGMPFGRGAGGAVPPVLSAFVDDLELDPPEVSFNSTSAGTLTWDFHSSATPPAKGAGDIGTGTSAAVAGANALELDLSAYAGETGYIHFRVTNGGGDSNILTSQEITVPSQFADFTAMRSTVPVNTTGSGTTVSDLALNEYGLFNGVLVSADGANDWRTAEWTTSHAASNGVGIPVKILIQAGTSGRCRVDIRAVTGGARSSVTGTLGSLSATATAAGSISSLVQTNLGGGNWLIEFTFTASSASLHIVEMGPFATLSGQTIIWLASRWVV